MRLPEKRAAHRGNIAGPALVLKARLGAHRDELPFAIHLFLALQRRAAG
jgi:hypothetical protein